MTTYIMYFLGVCLGCVFLWFMWPLFLIILVVGGLLWLSTVNLVILMIVFANLCILPFIGIPWLIILGLEIMGWVWFTYGLSNVICLVVLACGILAIGFCLRMPNESGGSG